jgi:cell division protein YceG involved in septum cleavage
MDKKIKLTLLVLIVFVFGVVTGFIFSQVWWMRGAMSPFYGTSLTEIAIDAQQLHKDMANDVLKRKVMALPPLTQSYYILLPIEKSCFFNLKAICVR